MTDELESLQIEIRRDEVELELERLRLANRRLSDRLAQRRRHLATDIGTAGAFATAAVAIAAAAGAEPFFSTALALVAIVGGIFGLTRISTRSPIMPSDD